MNKYIIGILFFFSQLVNSQTDTTVLDKIPFTLSDHNNLIIQAILNEKDSLDLMFHTAANDVSLIKGSADKFSSIHWDQAEDVESWGGESSSRYSGNNSLQIGKFKKDSIAIWESENSGPLTDGKFGPNFFGEAIMEINFDQKLIIIHSSLPEYITDYTKLDLILENGFMFIEGKSMVGDSSYVNKYLIHSGYGGTVLYDDVFVASSKIGEELLIVDEKELKDSYGNVLKTKKAILPTFKIGEEEFKEMPVGFFEGAIARQSMSVLGGDLLKRFNLIIDVENALVYVQSNGLIDLPYTKF